MNLETRIAERLDELKSEFERGQKLGLELEAQLTGLRDQLLRISGAIRVLSEISEVDDAVGATKLASIS